MSTAPLTPPPQEGKSPILDRWLYLVWKRINAAGQIGWDLLNWAGSNLTNIETRNHSDLQNLNTTSYTHLTAAQAAALTGGGETTLHSHAGGGVTVSNIIAAPLLIPTDTSYIVLDYLRVESDLTVEGNLGVL